MRARFGDYLKAKYTNDGELQRAWVKSKDAKKLTLSNTPFPSRSGDDYVSRDPQRKEDVDNFWNSIGTDVGVEDDAEEIN